MFKLLLIHIRGPNMYLVQILSKNIDALFDWIGPLFNRVCDNNPPWWGQIVDCTSIMMALVRQC